MATRSGGFGSSTNPFGSGSLGSISQYDIGGDLADLAVYETEVAWGNGLASDDAYIAALQKSIDATDPHTQKRDTAQNKMDDAVYRIGRSKAQSAGLDALVAYDQSAVTKMTPDNVRYRDVKDSLDSELAQRRSRDYGKLVLDYNKGKTSTQTLLSWVSSTLGSIAPDDPDYANWQGTQQDLTDRISSEKDSQVYQDFQQGKMKSGPFLSYIETRRAGFDPTSPDYADWTRRLEDARKQVGDANQAKADTAFFSSYEEGHKSDTQYLTYLRARIKGMKADDPDRASWQHRLNQAAFSLAEDKLRFDVQTKKKPVGALVSFYRSYRSTLNPGSAEWRTITRALDSLGAGGGGSSGGTRSSGGSGGGGSSSGKAKSSTGSAITTKAIPTYDMSGVFSLLTINPNAPKKDQGAAKKFFDLNYTSLENARQRGDSVWLFYDPRKPGAVVAARNPDGSPALDAQGKPIMIRGSAYETVSDDAFGQLNVIKARYNFQLADIALQQKDPAQYAFHLKEGLNAQDKARLVGSQSVQKSFDAFYQSAQDGIDSAVRRGDYAAALNLANDVAQRLSLEMQNPQLDEVRRDKLDKLGEKLAANPLIPKVDPVSHQQIGGAVDLAGSQKDANGRFTGVALNPGWHHVLDAVDPSGSPDWGLQYDQTQDGSWEASHTEVTTSYGNAVVRGEVKKRTSGVNATVFVPTPEGQIRVDQSVKYLTFTDEHGQVVKAYSIDGKHWVRSLSGTPPQIEVTGDLKNAPDGSGIIGADGKQVFKAVEPGNKSAGYTFTGDPSTLGFYGQAAHAAKLTDPLPSGKELDDTAIIGRGGQFLGYRTAPQSLGAPGQQMQMLTMGDDGSLTFLSDRQQQDQETRLLGARGGPGATKSLGNPVVSNLGVRPGPVHTPALGPFGLLSGIIAIGVGLGAKVNPPARLGSISGPRRPDPTEPPALRATTAPVLGAKAKTGLPPMPPVNTGLKRIPAPVVHGATGAKKKVGGPKAPAVKIKPPPPPPQAIRGPKLLAF